jgi:hypothetical protein
MQLKITSPDGKAVAEKQSDISPVSVTVDEAQQGEWLCEVKATKTDEDTSIAFVVSVGIK